MHPRATIFLLTYRVSPLGRVAGWGRDIAPTTHCAPLNGLSPVVPLLCLLCLLCLLWLNFYRQLYRSWLNFHLPPRRQLKACACGIRHRPEWLRRL